MRRRWGSQVGLPRSLIWFSSKQSAGGLAAFRAFLKSEYSEENIEFWVSCEDYKKTKSPAKLSPKARKIYDEFISVQATKEVRAQNVPQAELSPGQQHREVEMGTFARVEGHYFSAS